MGGAAPLTTALLKRFSWKSPGGSKIVRFLFATTLCTLVGVKRDAQFNAARRVPFGRRKWSISGDYYGPLLITISHENARAPVRIVFGVGRDHPRTRPDRTPIARKREIRNANGTFVGRPTEWVSRNDCRRRNRDLRMAIFLPINFFFPEVRSRIAVQKRSIFSRDPTSRVGGGRC